MINLDKNFNATPEMLIDTSQHIYSLINDKIDINTNSIIPWEAPDKNTWEKLTYLSAGTVVVLTSENIIIPDVYKKPWVQYYTNSVLTKGIVIYTPDTAYIIYTHFGPNLVLVDMIKEALKMNGFPIDSIEMVDNSLLVYDKKICGFASTIRGSYISERAHLTISYNDDMYKAILPSDMYNRFTRYNVGITGITNIIPSFDSTTFFSNLATISNKYSQPFVDSTSSIIVSSNSSQNIITKTKEIFMNLDSAKKDRIAKVKADFSSISEPYLDLMDKHNNLKLLGKTDTLSDDDYLKLLKTIEGLRLYKDKLLEDINSYTSISSVQSVYFTESAANNYLKSIGW